MKLLTPKKWAIYILCVITILLFLFLGDESKRPLTYTAGELNRETGTTEYDYTTINEATGYYGLLSSTKTLMLDKGTYTVGIQYKSTGADQVKVIANDQILETYDLPTTSSYEKFSFTIPKDMEEIQIQVHYGGVGDFYIYSLSLAPEGRFYNDTFFAMGLVVILAILIPIILFIVRKRTTGMTVDQKKQNLFLFLILLFIGLFAHMQFMNSKLNWGDDICYHLARIEGIKDALRAGQFPVLIYPEAMYGHGYLNAMYPNLFLYIPAFIRLLGVSTATSYKFLFLLFNIGTAFVTYYSVRSMFDSKKAALFAALLYTICPYRFTNIYARAAVGEALAMTFMPLVIAGIYHVVLGNKKKWLLLTLGITGLLQSHILSALLGTILCTIVGICFLSNVIREKRYIEIIKAAIVALLLNLWFLIPFLYYYVNGNLSTKSLAWSNYNEYVLNISGLAGTIFTGTYRTLTLGLPIVACGVITLIHLFTSKEKEAKNTYLKLLFVLGCIFTFMLTSLFPGWEMMKIGIFDKLFSNIQFPWRLLGMVSVLFSITGAVCLTRSELLRPYSNILLIVLASIALLSSTKFTEEDFAYATYDDAYTAGHESKIIGIPKGTATIVYPYEWRLDGTTDDSLRIHEVLVGQTEQTTILDYNRTGTSTSFTYQSTASADTATFPIVGYEGYEAVDENGKTVTTTLNDTNSIQTELVTDGKEHTITIDYRPLTIFHLGNFISATAVLCLIGYPFGVKSSQQGRLNKMKLHFQAKN